ncbi:MAG TPA: triose-phosphate isomerase [Sphingomicrobium sp.]|nr:triose-phosphate isomerase [Sphingomicrobium sp.]
MALKKLVAGNWKMHGLSADLTEIAAIAEQSRQYPEVDVALCVPAILIERAARAVPGFAIGAQDVHHAEKGAHTGSISAHMLRDAGASLTIVGHSERREAQRESDAAVKAKAEAALACGLKVILCVGEALDVREAGRAVETVAAQLDSSLPRGLGADGLAIAYEPIWAIGTGKIPTLEEIGAMHAALRLRLAAAYGEPGGRVPILYGGSVKASNAAEIFAVPDVDGALVGGASLKAADFLPIVAAAARSPSLEGRGGAR